MSKNHLIAFLCLDMGKTSPTTLLKLELYSCANALSGKAQSWAT